ncbi:MAG: pilus assembly protein [Gammaproteobacteria bacterium]|uniref:pilus assembly protein n=1 Tax=Pseudomaricurvus alcaniphilus TaxID=1166482 RepID=UPI001408D7BF|nr:pilus assembly protein [Pseudomaricurvus alcaniphilus]MBR9911940.1 pilus assembly protein [Gammaproteobacteria bacterium]NHN36009.1 pilus assembly protein [Pseudomaricurvus alcaniphilus]
MSPSDKVNLSSLNIVGDELVATIEQAANKLEQFVAMPQRADLLQGCMADIRQISGTFSLIQLYGAKMLADEMLAAVEGIEATNGVIEEEPLSHLTNAFFVLPRYLEYTQQARRGMPVLLVGYINELRQLGRRPPIAESQFFEVNLDVSYTPRARGSALVIEDLDSLARRLRHMYQVGLLNLLQGKQVRSALGIMQRAMERLEIIAGARPGSVLWAVAGAALEVLRTNNMEINKSRKMLLTAVDREIKKLQAKGLDCLDEEAPAAILKQLLFILALAHKPSAKAEAIISTFAIAPLGYNDHDLRNEREILRGPSVNTVASVAAVIKDELRTVKEVLEYVAETRLVAVDEYQDLIGSISKVADILSVVGLVSASGSLKEAIRKIEGWRDSGEQCDAAEMISVADALLFVESTLSGLESLNLTSEKLVQINSLAQREVIASSQLAEAEMLVIQEAEAGLSLVKRGLNAFAESNYDHGHVKNVAATLNGVRGGLIVLNLVKAAAVVQSCIEFVEQTLLASKQPIALQQLLETFADAIIGLEYYMESVRYDKNTDDSVLSIAEESLQVLGHRVRMR